MKACVKAWRGTINENGAVTDEHKLEVIGTLRYGPVREIKELTCDISDDMEAEFCRLNSDFYFDHLEIVTEENA